MGFNGIIPAESFTSLPELCDSLNRFEASLNLQGGSGVSERCGGAGIPASHLSGPLKFADFLPRNTVCDVKFSAVYTTVLKPLSLFSFLASMLCILEV